MRCWLLRKALTVLVLGAALLTLASCGGHSRRSFVRFVNAAPDAGPLDITFNGSKILSAVAYATGSNYFTEAPGTTISLKITNAGGTLLDTKIGLTDQAYYTIAAVGLTAAPSTFTILQTADDHTAPISTAVKIRVLQLDPLYHVTAGDSGPVDAYVTPPTNTLNGTNADFSSISFQSTPAWVSIAVPTDGNLRIRVVPAASTGNTDPDHTLIPGWDSQTVLFKAGQVRTYLLLSNPTGTPFAEEGVFLNDLN
jgi:Domain of unknown function (DUF4397)